MKSTIADTCKNEIANAIAQGHPADLLDLIVHGSPLMGLPQSLDATWAQSVTARGRRLVDLGTDTSSAFTVRDRFYSAFRCILWEQSAEGHRQRRLSAVEKLIAWEGLLLFSGIGQARAVRDRTRSVEYRSKLKAIQRSQICIEFDLEGIILDANENFLTVTGYSLSDLKGKHHRILVAPEDRASQHYADFWQRLKSGKFESGEYRRIAKDGSDIWLQATYNPILDIERRPVKVLKIANDVTQLRNRERSEALHMRRLQEQSELRRVALEATNTELVPIVAAIDSVARQTSLLALNATIEASRAERPGAGSPSSHPRSRRFRPRRRRRPIAQPRFSAPPIRRPHPRKSSLPHGARAWWPELRFVMEAAYAACAKRFRPAVFARYKASSAFSRFSARLRDGSITARPILTVVGQTDGRSSVSERASS